MSLRIWSFEYLHRGVTSVFVGRLHNNNNYYYYLLQLGCHPVAVVILRVNKI